LTGIEGAKVRVLWDPYETPVRAAILAERGAMKFSVGDLICQAVCINPPPVPVADENWQIVSGLADYGLAEAMAAKKAIGRAVRTEHRSLAAGGKRSLSEVRGPDGSVLRADSAGGDGVVVSITGGVDEWKQNAGTGRKPARRRADATEEDVAALEAELAEDLVRV
jgi:hypothetical protein